MAQQLIADALGEAVLQIAHQASIRASVRARQLAEWLRDNARPPPRARLEADGTYSGVALLDHNRVVLLIAARHERGEPPKPLITPPAYDTPPPRDSYSEPKEPVYRDGYRDWGWSG